MTNRFIVLILAIVLALTVAGLLGLAVSGLSASGAEPSGANALSGLFTPTYTPDGKLKLPESYREWIFLSSGLDMTYSDEMEMGGHSMFDNVFVSPEAYREFRRTGTWADQTLFVKEARRAGEKGSINRHGKFQTADVMEVEVHVKDTRRFTGGWAFFAFSGAEPAQQIPLVADCYGCHRQHAAVDTTFVQFYPTLLEVAARKGTLAPGYRP